MGVTTAQQPLWAKWLLFVLVGGAVAFATTAVFTTVAGAGLEAIILLSLVAALVGSAVSVVPGSAFYVLYEAVLQTAQPKWEYDEVGNGLFLLGSLGPALFLMFVVFARCALTSRPMEQPALLRLFGISTIMSVAVLFLFYSLEVL